MRKFVKLCDFEKNAKEQQQEQEIHTKMQLALRNTPNSYQLFAYSLQMHFERQETV